MPEGGTRLQTRLRRFFEVAREIVCVRVAEGISRHLNRMAIPHQCDCLPPALLRKPNLRTLSHVLKKESLEGPQRDITFSRECQSRPFGFPSKFAVLDAVEF